MIVDCMTCPVRNRRCDDCAVTVLHASAVQSGTGVRSGADLQLDAAERRVVSMFVRVGLVKGGTVAQLRARQESEHTLEPQWEVG